MSDRVHKIFERDLAHSSVVPSNRVIRSAEVAHVGGRPESAAHTPSIELITEANVVRAIDVTCACGTKMRLWCSYEPAHEQKAEVAE
jgi:hypothetical protein